MIVLSTTYYLNLTKTVNRNHFVWFPIARNCWHIERIIPSLWIHTTFLCGQLMHRCTIAVRDLHFHFLPAHLIMLLHIWRRTSETCKKQMRIDSGVFFNCSLLIRLSHRLICSMTFNITSQRRCVYFLFLFLLFFTFNRVRRYNYTWAHIW